MRTATGSTSNLIGGATVAVLTVTGALMIYTLRNRPADKVLLLGASLLPAGVALILLAVHSASLPLFFSSAPWWRAAVFGAGFLGGPAKHRAAGLAS